MRTRNHSSLLGAGEHLSDPEDLLNLLALLQSWRPNQPYAESEGFAVRRMAGGYVQLWCACAGLLLFEHELMQLRDLLW